MNQKKKLMTVVVCLLVLSVTVMGTLAWLTDRDQVVNTFTVGNVDIVVDETDVNENGEEIPGADRVKENNYHLIPGCEYLKDPTMTVKAGSVESYTRMILTVHNASAVQAIIDKYELGDYKALFSGWDETVWNYYGFTEDTAENTISFEFRYHKKVPATDADVELEPLFTTLVVPGKATGEEMAALQKDGFKMTVVGHAIQTAGFDTVDEAWEAFDAQMESGN